MLGKERERLGKEALRLQTQIDVLNQVINALNKSGAQIANNYRTYLSNLKWRTFTRVGTGIKWIGLAWVLYQPYKWYQDQQKEVPLWESKEKKLRTEYGKKLKERNVPIPPEQYQIPSQKR